MLPWEITEVVGAQTQGRSSLPTGASDPALQLSAHGPGQAEAGGRAAAPRTELGGPESDGLGSNVES